MTADEPGSAGAWRAQEEERTMGGGTDAGGVGGRIASGTLGGGSDAVLLARVDAGGGLVLDVVNDAARTLFGIGEQTLPDVPLSVEMAPLGVRALLGRIRAGAQRDRTTREQVALTGPDGSRVVVDVQLEPLPTTDGELATTRVLAVIRLAETSTEPAAAPPAVGVFRTELGLGAVFIDDALLALLGLAHEQALGHGWLEAVHMDDRARAARAVENRDAPDEAVDLECRIVRGAVDERPARIRAVPVRGDDGTLTGYLASLEDLTD